MIAVIPAAGLGKRMRAVSGDLAKELLPVAGEPVLQRVIREALDAGVDQVVVVSSVAKPALNEYVFGLDDPRLVLAFQDEPKGLAHAVACAGVVDEPVLVLMADSFFAPCSPLSQLRSRLDSGAWACMAVRRVPRDQLHLYGVAAFDDRFRVSRVVEKPEPEDAPSDWAVSGRFGLSTAAMQSLHQAVDTWDGQGEINLSIVLRAGLAAGHGIYAVPVLEEMCLYDCGDPDGYRKAVKELGV